VSLHFITLFLVCVGERSALLRSDVYVEI